ncbi:aromatic acid exporter family protein [Kineococcus sp. NUM-3379]
MTPPHRSALQRLRTPATWRGLVPRVLPTAATTARLTSASVTAYLLTLWLTDGPVDLTGALTALLVIQASAYSTVRMGLVRVGAVLTGVLIAVVLSSWVGLTWWSLALAVAASLLLAAVLRLGEQALETPISAMLVLAVGGQGIAAETRVVTTLIGAGVGVAFNLLLPPPVPTRAAVTGVRDVAAAQAGCLLAAADSMSQRPVTRAEAATWLAEAREVAALAEQAAETVRTVKDVRRLNARALGTADVEPALRTGLEALDRSVLAIRTLFALVLREAPQHPTPDDGYGHEVREAFSVVLTEVAACLQAFGALVEAETAGREAEVEATLAESLEDAREARAILTELMFVDPRAETSLWLLRGSVLAAVEHVLEPLDLENRARQRRELRRTRDPAPPAVLVPVVRRMLPRDRSGLRHLVVRTWRRARRPVRRWARRWLRR